MKNCPGKAPRKTKSVKARANEWADKNYHGEGPTDVVEECIHDAYKAGWAAALKQARRETRK